MSDEIGAMKETRAKGSSDITEEHSKICESNLDSVVN